MQPKRGRAVPPRTQPKRATLPASNLTLTDGRVLELEGQLPPMQVGPAPRDVAQMRQWRCADGMVVLASLDDTRHGRLLHVSLSYRDHYPFWQDIKAVRAAFYPANIDVMLVLPQERDYVNIHEFCMQMWQTPTAWDMQ